MSERRRHLFVLLIVLGLIAGSLIVESSTARRDQARPRPAGRRPARLPGQADASRRRSRSESLQRALDIMRDRVDAFGVSEPELARTGEDQIEVNLPGVDDAERAAKQVGSTAQLFFYDWEAERPRRELQDQRHRDRRRPAAGHRPLQRRQARRPSATSRCRRTSRPPPSPRFYAFDKVTKKPYNNGIPGESRAEALDGPHRGAEGERRGHRGQARACSSLRDEKPSPTRPTPTRFWIIRDNPGLSGTDIKNPEQNFDQQRRQRADRHLRLLRQGPQGVPDDHGPVAQRGADNANPLNPDPEQNSQHFAIALDNELVSTPLINYRENPDGIDGSTGAQISGGFTITSAQDLAKILKTGALPLRLELISRSQVSATLGKQALNQGLKAGARRLPDRRAVPARLLPRAGRHRGGRPRRLRASTSTRSSSSSRSR